MNAKSNRENMPTIAGVVDQFRKYFGQDVRVTYAKENSIEIGKRPPDDGIIPPPVFKPKPSRKAEHIPTTTVRTKTTRRP